MNEKKLQEVSIRLLNQDDPGTGDEKKEDDSNGRKKPWDLTPSLRHQKPKKHDDKWKDDPD